VGSPPFKTMYAWSSVCSGKRSRAQYSPRYLLLSPDFDFEVYALEWENLLVDFGVYCFELNRKIDKFYL
jgi:hypothetical protein